MFGEVIILGIFFGLSLGFFGGSLESMGTNPGNYHANFDDLAEEPMNYIVKRDHVSMTEVL